MPVVHNQLIKLGVHIARAIVQCAVKFMVGLESPARLLDGAANLPLLYFFKLKICPNVGQCSK